MRQFSPFLETRNSQLVTIEYPTSNIGYRPASPTNLYPVKFFVEDERSGFNRGNKPNELNKPNEPNELNELNKLNKLNSLNSLYLLILYTDTQGF